MHKLMFIDSHIHLNAGEYQADLPALLANAFSKGVKAWIIPGTTLSDVVLQVQIAKENCNCFNAFGIHPWFLDEMPEDWYEVLTQALKHHQAVAVGECGLDFSREDHVLQKQIFEDHVKLSITFNLPLIIHSYKAVDDVLKILRKYPSARGVFHAINCSPQQLTQILAQGFYVGFGGSVTYSRAKRLQRLLAQTPLDRLLIETDGPYQIGAYGENGHRHLPADLLHIAHFIAEQKSLELIELANITTTNAIHLFNLEIK